MNINLQHMMISNVLNISNKKVENLTLHSTHSILLFFFTIILFIIVLCIVIIIITQMTTPSNRNKRKDRKKWI